MDIVELVDQKTVIAQAPYNDGNDLSWQSSRESFLREIAHTIDQWVVIRLETMPDAEAANILRQVADLVVVKMSGSRSEPQLSGWQSALNAPLIAKLAEQCLARAHFVYGEIGWREFIEPFINNGPSASHGGERLSAYLDLGQILTNFTEEVFVQRKLLRAH